MGFSAMAGELPKKKADCFAAREYITTLGFLREHKDFQIKEDDARKLSDQVSLGCTGAAQRFIKVTNLLVKSNMGTADALRTAVKFVEADDKTTETFLKVFQTAFLADEYDLDLPSSLRYALALSVQYQGEPEYALADFAKVSEFCLERKGLDLSKPYCAELGVFVARTGMAYPQGAAPSFFELLDFVRSEGGPSRSTAEALNLSKEILGYGPLAVQNFRYGYQFAVSKEGFSQPYGAAMEFAKRLASRSTKEESARGFDFERPSKNGGMQRALGSIPPSSNSEKE